MTDQPKYLVGRYKESPYYRAYRQEGLPLCPDVIWRGNDFVEGRRMAAEANRAEKEANRKARNMRRVVGPPKPNSLMREKLARWEEACKGGY